MGIPGPVRVPDRDLSDRRFPVAGNPPGSPPIRDVPELLAPSAPLDASVEFLPEMVARGDQLVRADDRPTLQAVRYFDGFVLGPFGIAWFDNDPPALDPQLSKTSPMHESLDNHNVSPFTILVDILTFDPSTYPWLNAMGSSGLG